MGKRGVRVNELIRRVLNEILRSNFRAEAVMITITEVDVSPDLRRATAHYSVLGDDYAKHDAEQFFKRHRGFLHQKLYREVTLKYSPQILFQYDESFAKGSDLVRKIEDIVEGDNN